MGFSKKNDIKKALKTLEKADGTLALSENPTPLEEFRFDIQQKFVAYIQKEKIIQRQLEPQKKFVKSIYLLTLLLFSCDAYSGQTCDYEKNDCPEGQFCINIDKGVSECRNFDETLPKFKLPFRSQVWCDQGNLTPKGNSHSW